MLCLMVDPNDCIAVTPSDVEDDSSTTLSGSYIDYGQLRFYSEEREQLEVDEEEEEDSEVEDEEVEVDEALEVNGDPVACDLFGQAPCDWDSFGEEIWEECNSLKEGGLDNKVVRFHAYKLYTRVRHGILHHFDQRPLPICIHGEIIDSWPDPNHSYTGFQYALNHDAAN
jgi:hypothetical protein